MKKRTDIRRFGQGVNGYKLGVAVVLGLLTFFFLLVTIMPIILFETLEDTSWELKTFATSYRPLAALIGLVLLLATGWCFLRVVRGPQTLPARRRRTTKPAEPAVEPDTAEQPVPGAAQATAGSRPQDAEDQAASAETGAAQMPADVDMTWPTPGVTEPVFTAPAAKTQESRATAGQRRSKTAAKAGPEQGGM